MKLDSLKLVNFRNYETLNINFDEGIDYIVGDNAKGKTNLVEAIYSLSFGKSFRTQNNEELIKKDAKLALISAKVSNNDTSKSLEIEISRKGRRVLVNKKLVKRLSELNKILNVICFVPSDVNLLKGTPKGRRQFLNISISKLSDKYLNYLIKYERLLKERNEALKEERVNENLLEIITDQMIEVSKEIYIFRKKFVNKLNELLLSIYKEISITNESLSIKYLPLIDDEANYFKILKERYKESKFIDLKRKVTTIGIHKEDFEVYINDKNVGIYGSQGENRLSVISLKIATYYLSKDDNLPIIILDDVLSELDDKHEENLMNYLSNLNQVFITNTKKSDYFNKKYYICSFDTVKKED